LVRRRHEVKSPATDTPDTAASTSIAWSPMVLDYVKRVQLTTDATALANELEGAVGQCLRRPESAPIVSAACEQIGRLGASMLASKETSASEKDLDALRDIFVA